MSGRGRSACCRWNSPRSRICTTATAALGTRSTTSRSCARASGPRRSISILGSREDRGRGSALGGAARVTPKLWEGLGNSRAIAPARDLATARGYPGRKELPHAIAPFSVCLRRRPHRRLSRPRGTYLVATSQPQRSEHVRRRRVRSERGPRELRQRLLRRRLRWWLGVPRRVWQRVLRRQRDPRELSKRLLRRRLRRRVRRPVRQRILRGRRGSFIVFGRLLRDDRLRGMRRGLRQRVLRAWRGPRVVSERLLCDHRFGRVSPRVWERILRGGRGRCLVPDRL